MRQPKPFFRKQTQSWYLKLGKEFIHLGKDKEAAYEKYHEVMDKRNRDVPLGSDTVAHILDLHWQWMVKNLAESTCDRRYPWLQSFGLFCGPKLKLRQLKPHHVQKWIDEHFSDPGRHSDTYRNNLITVIKRAISWAAEMGYVERSPIEKLKKPRASVRRDFIAAIDWRQVIKAATDQQFRDFLTVMLASGMRPAEIFKVRAHHLHPEQRCLVLPDKRSGYREATRTVWLCNDSFSNVRRVALKYPEGPLFRNSRERGWTRNSVRCRFRHLKKVLKMPDLTATTLRHSFAHHRLSSGQDSLIVSKMMGHVDGRMLATRYGHIEQNNQFMLNEVNRTAIRLSDLGAESAEGVADDIEDQPGRGSGTDLGQTG